MKILCLHGLRHNGTLLEQSMKGISKKFKNIEFVFINSKFKFENEENLYCWWNANRENALTIDKYDLINESINYILQYWNKDIYDGILGFSQGSVVAQIFCYYVQNKIIETYAPKFAILCSSSEISDLNLKKLYETKLNLPICYMYGSKDPIINSETNMKLIEKLGDNVYILEHNGGHYVSSNSGTIDKLQIFFNSLSNN